MEFCSINRSHPYRRFADIPMAGTVIKNRSLILRDRSPPSVSRKNTKCGLSSFACKGERALTKTLSVSALFCLTPGQRQGTEKPCATRVSGKSVGSSRAHAGFGRVHRHLGGGAHALPELRLYQRRGDALLWSMREKAFSALPRVWVRESRGPSVLRQLRGPPSGASCTSKPSLASASGQSASHADDT